MIKPLVLLFLLCTVALHSRGQYRSKPEPDKQVARDNFQNGNYKAALEEYLILNKQDADNPLFNYRLGVCYLNMHGDKTLAIPHLEFACRTSEFEALALYDLAKAYMVALRYDDAITTWEKYKEKNPNLTHAEVEYVDRQVEVCHTGRELVKFPLSVKFEHLGDDVNSPYPDYYPFVTSDESEMVYTTRRKGTTGGYETFDGYFTSDIFISYEKGGDWSKGKSLGAQVNTSGDDEATSLSADGKHLLIYSESDLEYGDVLYASRKNRGFNQRELLDASVNSPSLEVAGTLSPDGNILVFSSDKPGGQGELDLYMSRKLPNGQWGTAVSLGDHINTPYHEDFPLFSEDGTTLYFASQGHAGLGGFDVFRTAFNPENNKFSDPSNLGYPLNDATDNMTISFTSNGRYAYLSRWREDSFGDLDIYRVVFEKVDQELTAVRGTIFREEALDYNSYKQVEYYSNGGLKKAFPLGFVPPEPWVKAGEGKLKVKEGTEHVFLLIFDHQGKPLTLSDAGLAQLPSGAVFKEIKSLEKPLKNFVAPTADRPVTRRVPIESADITLFREGEMYGTYQSIGSTGRFVIIAPPGNYQLEIEVEGMETFTEKIVILDKGSYQQELEKDIVLKSKSTP